MSQSVCNTCFETGINHIVKNIDWKTVYSFPFFSTKTAYIIKSCTIEKLTEIVPGTKKIQHIRMKCSLYKNSWSKNRRIITVKNTNIMVMDCYDHHSFMSPRILSSFSSLQTHQIQSLVRWNITISGVIC